MRYWFITLLLVLLPVAAWADAGHQAKYSISFDLSAEMKALLSQQGASAADMSEFTMPPMDGEMWWTEKNIKLSLNMPGMMPGEEAFTGIILLDLEKQVMFLLDPETKEASKIDLTDPSQTGQAPGLMGINPSDLTGDWAADIERLNASPATTVKDLGQVTVNGTACKHYSFEVDSSKLPDATDSTAEDTSLAGMLGTYGGEAWIAEDTGMPAKVSMNLMGMDMVYQLSDVKDWTPVKDAFSIPEGYTITTMDSPLENLETSQL